MLEMFASGVPFVGQNVAAVRGAGRGHSHPRPGRASGELRRPECHEPRQDPAPRAADSTSEPFRQALIALPEINAAFATGRRASVADIDRDSLLPVVDDAVGELVHGDRRCGAAAAAPSRRCCPTRSADRPATPGPRHVPDHLPEQRRDPRNRRQPCRHGAHAGGPRGRCTLETQADSSTFAPESGTEGQVFLQLPPETLALYADDFAGYNQNFSRTPNFPTTAQLFTSLWAPGRPGCSRDGVISIDPVVLSYILSGDRADDGADGTEITADNAVDRVAAATPYERFRGDWTGRGRPTSLPASQPTSSAR